MLFRSDFFTSDDYAFPKTNHYVVREISGPEPPGIPTGVRAVRDPASRDLVVSWSDDWGAAQYEVWRSRTPGATGTKIASTRLMRVVDTARLAGPAYYTVRAQNSAGTSSFSAPAQGPTR